MESFYKRAVTNELSTDTAMSWDELAAAVDVSEDVLEDTLAELQKERAVTINPRRGGFLLLEGNGTCAVCGRTLLPPSDTVRIELGDGGDEQIHHLHPRCRKTALGGLDQPAE